MFIYILVGAIIIWGLVDGKNKYIYQLSLIVLFFMSAMRNPSLGGTDSYYYQEFYNLVPTLGGLFSFDSYYAAGYTFINSFSKTFCDSYVFYQAIYAALTIFLLYIVLELTDMSQSEKCMVLFAYFCYRFIWNSWVLYRQNIANLLFWAALLISYRTSLNWKRLIIQLVGVLAGGLFHSSAIANIPILIFMFLFSKQTENKQFIFTISFSLFLFIFSDMLFEIILNVMEAIDDRYSMYHQSLGGINKINYLLRMGLYVIFYYLCRDVEVNNRNLVMNSLSIMVLIGSINVEIVTRMYEYYAIGLYIAMGYIPFHFPEKIRKLGFCMFILMLVVIFIRFVLVTDNGLYMHYSFV